MKKIYKIYFDGETVTSKEEYIIDNGVFYEIYRDKDKKIINSSSNYDIIDVVSTYSLGDIVAYTFDEDRIDELIKKVKADIHFYHSEQIFIKEEAIEEHRKVIDKLRYLNAVNCQ